MAQIATRNSDDALDIVQDSMIKLTQSYSDKPSIEWKPLFYRILSNRITDWHRQQKSTWQVFKEWINADDEFEDVFASTA